jgi:hypothetical protein
MDVGMSLLVYNFMRTAMAGPALDGRTVTGPVPRAAAARP